MTASDLVQIKELLVDLRFIQAAAMVGSGQNESKSAIEYMRNINRLENVINLELEKTT